MHIFGSMHIDNRLFFDYFWFVGKFVNHWSYQREIKRRCYLSLKQLKLSKAKSCCFNHPPSSGRLVKTAHLSFLILKRAQITEG